MREMGKVVGINLAVLLALTGIFMAIDAASANDGGFVMMGMLFLVPIQTLGCFITSLAMFAIKRNEYGLGFIVAALVVAVVGFSACWGGISVVGDGNFI